MKEKGALLFAVSSLGLGHATRTLPIIRHYHKAGYQVHILSTGKALAFLREEFGDGVGYHDYPDYPAIERGRGLSFYWFLLQDSFATIVRIRHEHAFVESLVKQEHITAIFSDGRYGAYAEGVPSFILSHQISFVLPRGMALFQWIADWFNRKTFQKFDHVFIPDYAEEKFSLAGRLSHTKLLLDIPHSFIGILSPLTASDREKQDISYLFIISGYLMGARDTFIRMLRAQSAKLTGKKVFVLGNVGEDTHEVDASTNTEIYSHVGRKKMQELYGRAHWIVSRSGYTTIMDVVELGKKAFMVATPRQTEQEYLAEYGSSRGYFLSARREKDVDLVRVLKEGSELVPLRPPTKTKEAVAAIAETIARHEKRTFFSFVIPAHNEAEYIEKNLASLKNLSYPEESFEVIVVENGSTDDTLERARNFASKNIKVLTTRARGVSHARNLGIKHVSSKADWIIFLDAHTNILPSFLESLSRFLKKKPSLTVGTTEVQPDKPIGAFPRFIFFINNVGHRLSRTSFAIHIVRADLKDKISYDEALTLGEDIDVIRQAERYGTFFYFPTKEVETSTRRFEAVGWLRLTLKWTIDALLPKRLQRKKEYERIR